MVDNSFKLTTPVAFFIFNRPDATNQVFKSIKKAQPTKLFVVADGPREGEKGETNKVKQAREIIDKGVNWDCKVYTSYSEVNLGCKKRVSSGLDWVFDKVEEAIILEDDCLPNQSFFQFCEDLLKIYRNDSRVMIISGINLAREWKPSFQSYHFSYYGGIWGWASWRRAWHQYDVNMTAWGEKEIRERVKDVIADNMQWDVIAKTFDMVYEGLIDTWDYQWFFARLMNSGLSIVPSKNLVANIGFGSNATHTTSKDMWIHHLPAYELDFPLKINPYVAVDRGYDKVYAETGGLSSSFKATSFKNTAKKIINRFKLS